MANGVLRPATSFLLFLNFSFYVIVLGLCGWAMNKIIDPDETLYGANDATGYFVIVSLVAGAVGAGACLFGLNHLLSWGEGSLPAAAGVASVAWSLTMLALGFASKHIRLHTDSHKLKAVESFVIILSFTMLLYIGALHGSLASSKGT